ncbi:PEP-CTERM sorting domain-containing protein [Roseibacillus ishigakijimensis]|nr:PEP-CTERM sorting domain-containing protein [Roseibacillus ishigakijimensis]
MTGAAMSTHASVVLYSHTFDDTANDSTPALQVFDNGNSHSDSIADGSLQGNGSGAVGFNTVTTLDLSSYPEFTISFVVENNFSAISGSGLNGTFFGLSFNDPSPDSNPVNGTALYNNTGSSLGLQVGSGRGTAANTEWYLSSTYSAIGDFSDDAVDGYTISIRFAEDTATGNTDLTITSEGLATDLNFNTVAGTNYANLAGLVTPNVSTQGGTLNLDRLTITTVPEPSSVGLSLLGLAMLLGHRRRS